MKIKVNFNEEIKLANGEKMQGEETIGMVIAANLQQQSQALDLMTAWEIAKSLANKEELALSKQEFDGLKSEIKVMKAPNFVKAPAILIMDKAYLEQSGK